MQFSFTLIAFILQFHSVFATPMDGWELMDVVRAASIPDQSNGKGYECGNDFFSDSEVKGAVSKYHQYVKYNPDNHLAHHTPQGYSNVPQPHHISQEYEDFDLPPGHQNIPQDFAPKLYRGPLYSDSVSTKYILWPIKKEEISHSSSKYNSDPYYIVVKEISGEVIDVISKIINNDFTKCIRIDGSRTELSTSAPDMNNGYQCAHKFLSDELIQESLGLVWYVFGNSNSYPMLYVGRLYPANSNYLIWPIFSRDGLFDFSSVEAGPYFLVIDTSGNLIETVVQGLSNNFLRCIRSRISSRISSIEPTTNIPNQLSIPAPDMQSGYFCDLLFFSDKYIKEAVKAARTSKNKLAKIGYPSKYIGGAFRVPVLLWPLMIDGTLYKTGSPGFHRLILTEDFRVKGVGVKHGSDIRFCKEGVKRTIKNHEKSDFYCLDHIVLNQHLEIAAKNGCNIRRIKMQRFYPAKYVGPNFEKSGPYFTYPVLAGKNFVTKPGPDRVVINPNCEVVGAITYYPKQTGYSRPTTFAKCVKLQDRTETNTYILPNEPISEQRWKYTH